MHVWAECEGRDAGNGTQGAGHGVIEGVCVCVCMYV